MKIHLLSIAHLARGWHCALALAALTGCTSTQLQKINSAASTLAKGAATTQTDLATYGPTITSLAASVSGTGSSAKVSKQVAAVTADASAYASDAQILAQIVASLTAAAPATTGTAP